VFVYHLDDDTGVGPDTIASIAEFIARDNGQYHLAQGVLTFPYQYSPALFPRLADSVRPSDDLMRFFFFTTVKGMPLTGLHGEHLLIRASVENEIGWDYGPNVKVEDAYFALYFADKYPGKSTFLNSCSYGASPHSIKDMIAQRRRWCSGLIGLVLDRKVPRRTKLIISCFVTVWSTGPVQHVGLMLFLAFLLGMPNTSPVLRGVIAIWCFNFAYYLWTYLEGLQINLSVSSPRISWPVRLFYSIITVPLIIAFSAVEAWAGGRGIIDYITRNSNFEVISKRL
jgi:egghead protein (zeste-white 4 protein)